jgi:hypothetical protein
VRGHAGIIFEGGDELLAAQLSIEGKPSPRTHVGNALRVANSAITVPTVAAVGTRLKENIVSKGKAKVTLLAGPDGLKLSSRGELSWEPKEAGKFPLTLRIAVGDTTTELTAEIAVSVTQ